MAPATASGSDSTPTRPPTVTFTMQPPTADPNTPGAPTSLQFGPYTVDHDGYNQSSGVYDLLKNFTPQPNQGFHVELETNTTWSNGADTKYKVFWVTGCAPPEEFGSVSLDKVVLGPAPADDPAYTFSVVADDPDATVASPVTIKASDAPSEVASHVCVGSSNQPGASVVATVSSATSVAVVATNAFTVVLGETITRPDTTVVTTTDGTPAPTREPLARTGRSNGALIVLGFGLVGAGLALSVLGRRLRMAR